MAFYFQPQVYLPTEPIQCAERPGLGPGAMVASGMSTLSAWMPPVDSSKCNWFYQSRILFDQNKAPKKRIKVTSEAQTLNTELRVGVSKPYFCLSSQEKIDEYLYFWFVCFALSPLKVSPSLREFPDIQWVWDRIGKKGWERGNGVSLGRKMPGETGTSHLPLFSQPLEEPLTRGQSIRLWPPDPDSAGQGSPRCTAPSLGRPAKSSRPLDPDVMKKKEPQTEKCLGSGGVEAGGKRARGGTVPLIAELARLNWLERGRRTRSQKSGHWRSCSHCSVWAEPEGGGEGRAGAAATAARPPGRHAEAAGSSLTFRGGRGGGGRGFERIRGDAEVGGGLPGQKEEDFGPLPRAPKSCLPSPPPFSACLRLPSSAPQLHHCQRAG